MHDECFTAVEEDGVTTDLESLNFLAKLMVLHRQIRLSLAIADIAEATPMWSSHEQVPSLHRVAPRHLKLVTSSNFWPFVLISALMLFVPLLMFLVFSVPISIAYVIAVSSSLLVRS